MDCECAKEEGDLTRPSSVQSINSALKSLNLPSMPPNTPLPPLPAKKKNNSISETTASSSLNTSPRSFSSGSFKAHPIKPLKYGIGKHAHVELMPQPSDDPEDPLNWPQWKKEFNLASLLIMVGLIGSMKTVFISINGALVSQFQQSHASIAALTAVPLMLSALTGLLSSMMAKTHGKRPVYLLSALLIFVGGIWNIAAGTSYHSCMGARVIQGLGWGAFDTLLMESIQDTYFEHERSMRISIHNVIVVSTTWGSPLIGSVISHKSGSFTVQFCILTALFFLTFPLLVLAAPETAFDRSKAAVAPTPASGFVPSYNGSPRLEAGESKLSRHSMKPWSFAGDVKLCNAAVQMIRALAAPTTIFVFLLTLIPYAALWSFSTSLAQLLDSLPIDFQSTETGLLLAGPYLLATLIVICLRFHQTISANSSCLVTFLAIAGGAVFAIGGLLAFGLYMQHGEHAAARPFNLALLSFQLGLIAAGAHALDTTISPLLTRSASFTASSMAVAHRSISNMHASVVILRNFATGILVLAMPHILSAADGLKSAAIALSSVQAFLAITIVCLFAFCNECIWKTDGKVMALLDLRFLRVCGNNNNYDAQRPRFPPTLPHY